MAVERTVGSLTSSQAYAVGFIAVVMDASPQRDPLERYHRKSAGLAKANSMVKGARVPSCTRRAVHPLPQGELCARPLSSRYGVDCREPERCVPGWGVPERRQRPPRHFCSREIGHNSFF